jgi:hypothetical protein
MSKHAPKLHSGSYGNGGRTSSGNGRPSHQTSKHSAPPRVDTPYRVAGTTAGQWTTGVSHNTTRIWREER